MRRTHSSSKFLLCVKNEKFPASLEVRKAYRMIPDRGAAAHRLVRIVDESGEDYLYPEDYFVPIELPLAVRKALSAAS